jgi:hypothetical protein
MDSFAPQTVVEFVIIGGVEKTAERASYLLSRPTYTQHFAVERLLSGTSLGTDE